MKSARCVRLRDWPAGYYGYEEEGIRDSALENGLGRCRMPSMEEEEPLFELELPDAVRKRRSISRCGSTGRNSLEEVLAVLNKAQRDRFLSQLLTEVKHAKKFSSEASYPMQIENIGHRLCMQGYRVLMRTRKGGGMSSNCLTNISHQFLVVVGANLAQEIIVEVSFKSHFVMCKPPESYMEVLSKLPDVFVGTKTMLDRVASKVAKEMKGAFAQLGHSTPPWREKGSILSKWNPEGCLEQDLLCQFLNTRPGNGPQKSKLVSYQKLSKADQGQLIPASRVPDEDDLEGSILRRMLF